MSRRHFVFPVSLFSAIALFATSCSSTTSEPAKPAPPDPARVEMQVRQSLEELAALGNKRAGSPEGRAAGDYVKSRFERAGLKDAHFESFSFPAFTSARSSLDVTVAGAALPMKHEVFAYSGKGRVTADVVYAGKGHEADYANKDVTGKIVLVERDPAFHRSAQYQVMIPRGAVAMLYKSTSPNNMIQIGTVTDPEDGLGPIPAVTIGSDDGQKLVDALSKGQPVQATIDVDASNTPAEGRNVVARIPGTDPSGAYVVVGAHYDTWYKGSLDNGTGVAALLALADELGKRTAPRRIGLVFVAYDGEELGLFGGYDFLRKHVTVGKEKMLGFINFEIPANKRDGEQIMAKTPGPIDDAIVETETSSVYMLYAGLDALQAVIGGFIPTDIQGMYWAGIQGVTTACNSPYYHTTEDTPDKVDLAFLASSATHFMSVVDVLDKAAIESFSARDPKVWQANTTLAPKPNGDLDVQVEARDGAGALQANAQIKVWLDVDDFTRAFKADTLSDASGRATVTIPADRLTRGSRSRWVHATAGLKYPLSESMIALK
jgi:aminopeptidase YwaD